MYRFDHYRRLEPSQRPSSLDRGFRAEVHDPLWFLARQWQLGEHRGEDASSPVWVELVTESTDVGPLPAAPSLSPQQVPPEPVVESELGDWWTPGRRVRLGAAVARARQLPPASEAEPELLLAGLPGSYARFDGRGYDGRALHARFPDDPSFAQVPVEPRDHWEPEALTYRAQFPTGAGQLELEDHRGGHLDWYSVDGEGQPTGQGKRAKLGRIPSRLRYPGAPHPRWWQIEDARVDLGGMAPDRGHFATLLLLDLVVSHSDDWFTFPLEGRAGTVLRLDEVRVRDSFDAWWKLSPPADWSMFQVRGLPSTALLLWPAVASPLRGAVVEEVILGIDEQSNLLWAVEQRAAGSDLVSEEQERAPAEARVSPEGGRQSYGYRPDVGARSRWHPYSLESVTTPGGRQRRLVQGRLADLSGEEASLFPAPITELLDPRAEQPPRLAPEAIPWNGLRLQRRWMLARQTTGEPQLWVQRQRLPLPNAPASLLRHDALVPGEGS